MASARTLILGAGKIGQRVARLHREEYPKQEIEGWVKSAESQQNCEEMGLPTQRVDFDAPFQIELAPASRHNILYTVAPPSQGEKDTRLRAVLQALDHRCISRFVLISTTGVYGDCNGAWVTEETPIKPRAERALRRADAESQLQQWANKYSIDYLVLRVPGIYARQNLPRKRLEQGTPVLAENQSPWSNRIHAEDLARACLAALSSPTRNQVINIADDAPSTMTEYFFTVADYLDLKRPPEVSLSQAKVQFSAGMLSYLTESRRIDNSKMKKLLLDKLLYPSLKDGLS